MIVASYSTPPSCLLQLCVWCSKAGKCINKKKQASKLSAVKAVSRPVKQHSKLVRCLQVGTPSQWFRIHIPNLQSHGCMKADLDAQASQQAPANE